MTVVTSAGSRFWYTKLLRFARYAVVTSLDQIHLRFPCPPFICVKSKYQM